MGKRYTAKFKFQIVLELLSGGKTAAQVAKAYGIHPNTASAWKNAFLEKGAEVFSQCSMIAEYERRIGEMEQLLGKKELEIALLKKFLGTAAMSTEQKVALVDEAQQTYGLNRASPAQGRYCVAAVALPKSSWYYHQKQKVAYQEKHADLLPILEEIARKHPEYGVPRIMPELREEYDIDTNHKVIVSVSFLL